MSNRPTRVGVVLTSLSGLNTDALKYLILHQNTLQASFEFELVAVPQDAEVMTLLSSKEIVEKSEVMAKLDAFFSNLDERLSNEANDFGLLHESADGYVVLSTARLSDNYYLDGKGPWLLAALGNWEHSMAPPSIVEFLLSLLVESALIFAAEDNLPNIHLGTKSCAFDFTAQLRDARWSVLSGHLCSSCKHSLEQLNRPTLIDDALLLLRREWLGTTDEPSHISVTAKKLGYDLYHTTGVKQSWRERIASVAEVEAVKAFFKVAAVLVGAALVSWFALKAK